MNRLPLALAATATSALLLASLAGCAPASSAAGTATAPTAAGNTAGKAAAVGSTDGACKYLSIADLDSITGRTYAASKDVPLSDPIDYSYCLYSTSGKATFVLIVSDSDASDVMSVENEAAGNKLVPLSGVGDSALDGPDELVVAFGQTVIAAGDSPADPGMHALTLSQFKTVVAKAHSNM